ncbi:MAG: DPP IV N-terminal domain-containing protein [Tissierellia bacterium]|nr:DPP IV N-terminal domain-containing protein [Tissierellia bacterium]
MDVKKYEAARELLPTHADKYILNKEIIPWFIGEGRFVFKKEFWKEEKKYAVCLLVDPINKTEKELFNYEDIAKELCALTSKEIDNDKLVLTNFKIEKNIIMFFYDNNEYSYNIDTKKLLTGKIKVKPGEKLSPDFKRAVFSKDYNLFIRELDTDEIVQITYDGCMHYDYGSRLEEDNSFISDKRFGEVVTPSIFWSPDSKKFVTFKVDQRNINELCLLQNVSESGEVERPKAHNYKYPLPGDENIATSDIYIYDMVENSLTKCSYGSFDMGVFMYFPTLDAYKSITWSPNGEKFTVRLISRNHKEGKLVLVNAKTGESETIDEETSDTFIFSTWYTLSHGRTYNSVTSLNTGFYSHYTENGKIFFVSERDGFNHIYEIDTKNNNKLTQITKGQWNVGEILLIDEDKNQIYFTGFAAEKHINPYFQQLYKIKLNNLEIQRLTPEDAYHAISIDPDKNYFIDYFDSVIAEPEVIVRDLDGNLCMKLLKSDSVKLLNKGFKLPKQFKFKGDDNITDIYGIMILPPDFNENYKYPLIEYCYGGPQRCNVPVHYYDTLNSGFVQSFAQLGFITIIIDGRGTPFRSKQFHDSTHKNLGECAGMPDHVSLVRQLCEKYPFIDHERIGIWGHSGGGYAAYKYIIEHGDLYKVAVSSSGNHFQELYVASWSEGFMNDYDKELWIKQSMKGRASEFNGKLLLIHGDMDDNVHPSNTMYIVNELIKANKDFDLLIIPNGNHHLSDNPYYQRKIINYFVENLMEENAQKNFSMK